MSSPPLPYMSLPRAVLAALGLEYAAVAQIEQRRVALVGFEHDVATLAAVAAGRAAERHEFFAAPSARTVATVAGNDLD